MIEEFLDLILTKGTTIVEDIFYCVKQLINSKGLPPQIIVSIVTEAAPSMLEPKVFIGQLQLELKSVNLIHFNPVQCLIHKEALCAKRCSMTGVISTVIKITNYTYNKRLSITSSSENF